MKAAIIQRATRMRSNSLRTVPPSRTSGEYDSHYETTAASILYKSPLPSQAGLPIYVLNAAAFPDAYDVDYDTLLPYVLARLPEEDDLLAGKMYEVIFFAGGQPDSATGDKKNGPGISWYMQVYQVLSRALRKRLQKIYIVHERSWVRVLTEVFSTIVSPKFKKKVVHVSSLSALALFIPLENLLIPPAVYLYDRKDMQDIYAPYATGRRAFGANDALPRDAASRQRLPRVLREATSFILHESNLKTEGLFRINPHSVLQGVLREAYDRGQHFIVWKEGDVAQVDPGMGQQTLSEVHEADAYGVHLAASLIKVWYRELRNPIIPESCYQALHQTYSSTTPSDLTIEDLAHLMAPSSQHSILPQDRRHMITLHLLPLLSIVTSYQASNKMSADNLAVCFAPALLCGSDQLQDAKMTSILRKLLGAAITQWSAGLDVACGITRNGLPDALKPPTRPDDYEDPLSNTKRESIETLRQQINLVDLNDNQEFSQVLQLPPRTSSLVRNPSHSQAQIPPMPKRKPAPVVAPLPRYSTIISTPRTVRDHDDHAYGANEKQGFADEQNGFPQEKMKHSPDFANDRDLQLQTTTRTAQSLGATTASISPMLAPSLSEIQGAQLRAVSGESAKSSDDMLFVKPTWTASSRKGSTSSNASHRKPTPPLIAHDRASDRQGRSDSGTNVPAYSIKPRTPSPGLLQRMQSWEKEANETSGGQRPSAGMDRKQSVDDLKRLYEERADTVASLNRSRSNASSRSGL